MQEISSSVLQPRAPILEHSGVFKNRNDTTTEIKSIIKSIRAIAIFATILFGVILVYSGVNGMSVFSITILPFLSMSYGIWASGKGLEKLRAAEQTILAHNERVARLLDRERYLLVETDNGEVTFEIIRKWCVAKEIAAVIARAPRERIDGPAGVHVSFPDTDSLILYRMTF